MSLSRRHPRAGAARAQLLALLSALLGGCGLTLDPIPAPVQNACVDDSTCGGGTCEGGMCLTSTFDESMTIGLEVVPAPDESQATLAAVFFPAEVVVMRTTRDLALPTPVIVHGRAVSGAGGAHVPVQVTFTPRPAFEGAPTTPIRASSVSNDFVVALEAGRVYDVLVEPSAATVPVEGIDQPPAPASEQYPPLALEGFVPEDAPFDGDTRTLVFEYPDSLAEACTAALPSGCTLRGHVRSRDAAGRELAEAGLRVRAVDDDGKVVSSSAITDEEGAFTLRVMPGASDYRLRVTPPDEVSTLPSIEVPVELGSSAGELTVLLPRLVPVTLRGLVGYEEGPGVTFLDGATVAFESTDLVDLGLEGELGFRRTAFSANADGASGEFTVDLLPGVYRVVVTPVDSARAGVLVTSVAIDVRSAGSVIQGQLFELPRRASFSGVIETPALEPVVGATIRARRLPVRDDLPASDVRRYGRSSETTSSAGGVYTLPVDLGTYDLVIRPGAGTGYCWHVVPDVAVGRLGVDLDLSVVLDAPVPLEGIVTDADGAPLASAIVRAYAILETKGKTRTVPIGETTTGADGSYRLLLPPRLHWEARRH